MGGQRKLYVHTSRDNRHSVFLTSEWQASKLIMLTLQKILFLDMSEWQNRCSEVQ